MSATESMTVLSQKTLESQLKAKDGQVQPQTPLWFAALGF
jgi:hypothetical protein